jgi:hypothetical protein
VLWNYAAFFSFAQRARWAAAILLRAAIDITRLWLLLALACPFPELSRRDFAQRAFWAKEILRRPAADMGPRLEIPRPGELWFALAAGANAVIALFNRSRSCSSSLSTAARSAISSPSCS